VRHRRRTCLRRSARADRRGAADGVAQDHHPCAAAPTTAKRWNNCAATPPARVAGRARPVAGLLAKHKLTTGLFVFVLGIGQRARANQRRRASGAQAEDRLARRHHAPRACQRWSSCSGWRPWCRAPDCTSFVWCLRNFASRSERTTAFSRPMPSCARRWCRRNPNHPRRPHRPLIARRPVRTTAQFG